MSLRKAWEHTQAACLNLQLAVWFSEPPVDAAKRDESAGRAAHEIGAAIGELCKAIIGRLEPSSESSSRKHGS